MAAPPEDAQRRRVLIVDDEAHIRLALSEALARMDLDVVAVAGGTEALDRLKRETFDLMLLDIKMPGLDGMEVLRRVRDVQPEVRVIMITAHGTVENAVEAMKLGAVDFLQKPFSVQAIRKLVSNVLARERLDPAQADNYEAFVELARRAIMHRQFDAAQNYARQALRLDEEQPEAHNLLGVLCEISGDRYEAQQRYRRALELDPAYASARANLRESVETDRKTSFFLSETKTGHDPAIR